MKSLRDHKAPSKLSQSKQLSSRELHAQQINDENQRFALKHSTHPSASASRRVALSDLSTNESASRTTAYDHLQGKKPRLDTSLAAIANRRQLISQSRGVGDGYDDQTDSEDSEEYAQNHGSRLNKLDEVAEEDEDDEKLRQTNKNSIRRLVDPASQYDDDDEKWSDIDDDESVEEQQQQQHQPQHPRHHQQQHQQQQHQQQQHPRPQQHSQQNITRQRQQHDEYEHKQSQIRMAQLIKKQVELQELIAQQTSPENKENIDQSVYAEEDEEEVEEEDEDEDEDEEEEEEEEEEESEEEETDDLNQAMAPKWTKSAYNEIQYVMHKFTQRSLDEQEEDEDTYDVTMVAEYAPEIFNYMRELELKLLPTANYMDNQDELTWQMRGVLIDWVVQVHSRFNLLPETLFLTVNYIDRFLSKRKVSLSRFQLVGAVALFIAAKYEEINCPTVQEVAYMADNAYSIDDFLKAERFMIDVLEFDMGWPGPMSFLRRTSKADDYDYETRTLAKYFLEITIMDSRFVASQPSWLAAGAHYLSRRLLNKGEWTESHVFYSGYTEIQLTPLAKILIENCKYAETNHRAIFEKYQERRYRRSSTFVQEYFQAVESQ